MSDFDAEAIEEFRKQKGNGMQSAVGEYTPSEFWDALDEIERLQRKLSAAKETIASHEATITTMRSVLLSLHRAIKGTSWRDIA